MARQTGQYRITSTLGEEVSALVSYPLPRIDPPLALAGVAAELHAAAMTALARLAVAGSMVPSTDWFLYGFVRKEAVVTSQIEGTQATLRDVLTFEATHRSDRPDDVREVCNYVVLQYPPGRQDFRSDLPVPVQLKEEDCTGPQTGQGDG